MSHCSNSFVFVSFGLLSWLMNELVWPFRSLTINIANLTFVISARVAERTRKLVCCAVARACASADSARAHISSPDQACRTFVLTGESWTTCQRRTTQPAPALSSGEVSWCCNSNGAEGFTVAQPPTLNKDEMRITRSRWVDPFFFLWSSYAIRHIRLTMH